jgi:hypothetical protein
LRHLTRVDCTAMKKEPRRPPKIPKMIGA